MSAVKEEDVQYNVILMNEPIRCLVDKKFDPPHPMIYRIVFWEKPYVLRWIFNHYRTSMAPSAMIAYSRYVLGGIYGIPPKEWVQKNMPYIALIHLYNSTTFAKQITLKFPDEFKEAAQTFRERSIQRNIIASMSEYAY